MSITRKRADRSRLNWSRETDQKVADNSSIAGATL